MTKEKKKFWRDKWFYFVLIVGLGGPLLIGYVAYKGMESSSRINDTKGKFKNGELVK